MFTLVFHWHFFITMFLNNNFGYNKIGQIKPIVKQRKLKNMELTFSMFFLVTFNFEAMLIYSGTSLKRTSYKADISLRRTKNFAPDEFLRKPLSQNLCKADTLNRTLHKADTFFKSRMNI